MFLILGLNKTKLFVKKKKLVLFTGTFLLLYNFFFLTSMVGFKQNTHPPLPTLKKKKLNPQTSTCISLS